jgi:DNA-binding transcriptional LysR family regulator
MALLTLDRLRLLLAVASRGTIAGAAEDVGYTASAVSQQLSALERQLGTSLLERSNRGVTLTPAGVRLSERASLILDLVDTATIEATQAGTQAAPITLRVGAFPTAISSLVVPAIALLEPLVRLTIVHIEPEQALADLAARRLDAALVDFYDMLPEPVPSGLRHVNLLTDPLHIAVRANRKMPRAVTGLATVQWVLGGIRSRLGRVSRIALRAAGLEPMVLVESEDHSVTFDAMSTLDVATVLPDLALRVAPTHVRPVPGIDLGCDRNIHLVTRDVPRPHPGFAMLENALRAIVAR